MLRIYVVFAGNKGSLITEHVYVLNCRITFEKFNYFDKVDQKKCVILRPRFVITKDLDVMRSPISNDMYVIDIASVATSSSIATCFVAKATKKDAILLYR